MRKVNGGMLIKTNHGRTLHWAKCSGLPPVRLSLLLAIALICQGCATSEPGAEQHPPYQERAKTEVQGGLTVTVAVPTEEEAKEILATAEGRWRPLLVAAIFTGLRASELRGLTWDAVDFKAKEIHVRQRADRYNEIGSPKSHAGERSVPMSPMVVNTLKEWKLACPKGDLGLVFPNGAGKIEVLSNIYRRGFGAAQEKCGMVVDTGRKDTDGKPILRPKYGMHALRHFCASWMIALGFPPKRLQSIMGHSSIQMTFDTYGHLFPNAEDDHARLAAGEISLVG